MSGRAGYADWIAVDWGTTHLRAWAMDEDGDVVAEARSDDGMGHLARDEFEAALLRLIDPWLDSRPMDVIACGMVGSRQGWAEAPYVAVPVRPATLVPVPVDTADPRLRVSILPGLKQVSPPDVMRGEETQVAGFLAAAPGFDGVLCLPGTHAKWVRISAGEVVSFRTFMTGELFDLLSGQSVLRHSIAPAGLDRDAFLAAVSDTLSKPEMLAQRLFSIRAGQLLEGTAGEIGRARLSGFLIGAELAASRSWWLGQEVVVAGAPDLAGAYAAALAGQGVSARTIDADPLTRLGLTRARVAMREHAS